MAPYFWFNTRMSKYKNIKTNYNGQIFHSKLEANYCQKLDILKASGIIESYSMQVRYPLKVNHTLVCTYIADFVVKYPDRVEVVDTKGYKTREYTIKKKLMEAIYGIRIKEISA